MLDVETIVAQPAWWRLLSRRDWWVYSVACLAWFFDSVDQQLFNLARDGAMESLAKDSHRAIEYGPYSTSVFLIGWGVGGLLFGGLGDRYGRAKILTITV